ncbi:Wadjet anti-phage system protein JetD domain-containing protein [Muricomes intestini]|jgi:hypothetical protein|uniref:Uncharacterized protein DUF2220 n=1 Tax=Muricomes intestini TaxID=1796634 RepID=A0A4R3K4R9_9FIRM|nr:Wadjet anti-phage system protein JetD domain-containing protein [Muricomes intestini]TCS77695.1 uncharacterized protein DUF2220 [Muricomes intestini]HAX53270.1 hypothetical protein [Lachnospiraceae bacterium]HBI71571.1 hypothetical protein [Lachnospiraceae bacterium]HCR83683.1 hypothetical protein [Lachnospiraceae bacterium]
MFSENQKKVLGILLDQYENSKTYQGENKITQGFYALPERVFKDYHSDYVDMNLVCDFENQMRDLENSGLISVRRNKGVIEKLAANPEKWQDYYRILKRQDKRTLQRIQIELYKSYMGEEFLLDRFCQEQIDRLRENKKAVYDVQVAEFILKLCRYILGNQEDILERELSVAVLGDSKKWEKQFRSRVCSLLKKYGDYDTLLLGVSDGEDKEDKRETERILLAEHHVYSNPAYVYFKGNAEILFDNGQKMCVNRYMPIAFSTETLNQLKTIQILDQNVMTVENLTSFNRMQEEHTFLIFLSGYHNSVKQQLIRKTYDANPGLVWQHFGDIDPDGFYIIENLRRGTGIDFNPVYMDREVLKKYKDYTKPLTDNDIRKATALIHNEMYHDIMGYMLDTGGKLEQEIVSWMGWKVK